MSVLIKGIEMPTTGLYLVSVDNTGGIDKTIVTVERMLRNRTTRQIVGSFELVPIPPHGELIDTGAVNLSDGPYEYQDWVEWAWEQYLNAPVFLPADPPKEEE